MGSQVPSNVFHTFVWYGKNSTRKINSGSGKDKSVSDDPPCRKTNLTRSNSNNTSSKSKKQKLNTDSSEEDEDMSDTSDSDKFQKFGTPVGQTAA